MQIFMAMFVGAESLRSADLGSYEVVSLSIIKDFLDHIQAGSWT